MRVNRYACLASVPWAALAAGLAGCSGGVKDAKPDTGDTGAIRAMSAAYGEYLQEHRNTPPKNEEEFRSFLATRQEELQESGLTIDEVFESPRNGEAFEWVYGRRPPAGPMGMMFIGYEKTPVDGKRLVIATRGMHELMDGAKFRSVFPDAE